MVTENLSPLTVRYFVDHEESITFEGHTYTPLHMYSDKLKTSMGMQTETAEIALSNVGNQVVKYLREIDISEMPCMLQLLHLDLLGTLTQYWHRSFKILGVRADQTLAVFMLGREIGRNQLPRDVLTAVEAPGLNSDTVRF